MINFSYKRDFLSYYIMGIFLNLHIFIVIRKYQFVSLDIKCGYFSIFRCWPEWILSHAFMLKACIFHLKYFSDLIWTKAVKNGFNAFESKIMTKAFIFHTSEWRCCDGHDEDLNRKVTRYMLSLKLFAESSSFPVSS